MTNAMTDDLKEMSARLRDYGHHDWFFVTTDLLADNQEVRLEAADTLELAASALESLTAENAALKQLHFEADDKRCHWQNEAERLLQQRNEAFERAASTAFDYPCPDNQTEDYASGFLDACMFIAESIRNLSKDS